MTLFDKGERIRMRGRRKGKGAILKREDTGRLMSAMVASCVMLGVYGQNQSKLCLLSYAQVSFLQLHNYLVFSTKGTGSVQPSVCMHTVHCPPVFFSSSLASTTWYNFS